MSGRGASAQNVIDSGARFRDGLNAGSDGRRRNRWRVVWRPHDNMPPIPAADRRVNLEFVATIFDTFGRHRSRPLAVQLLANRALRPRVVLGGALLRPSFLGPPADGC